MPGRAYARTRQRQTAVLPILGSQFNKAISPSFHPETRPQRIARVLRTVHGKASLSPTDLVALQTLLGNRVTRRFVERQRAHQLDRQKNDPVPQAEVDTSDSLRRKQEARSFIEQKLNSPVANGQELLTVLEAAREKYQLKDIQIDMRDPKEPKLGLVASPWVWLTYFASQSVGNNLSDYLVWGVIGTLSEAERWITRRKPKPGDSTQVLFGPLTGRGFGSYMLADPLTKEGGEGSEPSVTNPTWKILLRRKQTAEGKSSYYVLGHLLNDNIHGRGDTMENLTPLSQRSNNHSPIGHLKAVETDVKNQVKAGNVLAYQVVPKYGRSPIEWPRYMKNVLSFLGSEEQEVMAAEDHIPVGLWCKVWQYDSEGWRTQIKNEFVPQMQVGTNLSGGDHYYIKTDEGMVDVAEPTSIWRIIKGAFISALMLLMGWTSKQAVQKLLAQYCGEMGIKLAQFVATYQYIPLTIAPLLIAYSAWKASSYNQFPKDPTKTKSRGRGRSESSPGGRSRSRSRRRKSDKSD